MICLVGADTPIGKILSTIKGPVSYKAHGQKPDPDADILIYAGENKDTVHATDILKSYFNLFKGRFIYISSYHVYGHGFKALTEYSNLRPISEFGKMQAIHENMVRERNEYVVLRISETYGLKNGGDLVSDITSRVLNDVPITGSSTILDFIYKDDLVRAINAVIDNNIVCKTLNVGTNIGTSILELSRMIGKIYGKEPIMNVVEDGSASFNILNADKIRHLTGWVSRVELKQALPVIKAM